MDLEKIYRTTKIGLFIVLAFSMIGSGTNFFSSFFLGLFYPTYKELYASGQLVGMMASIFGSEHIELFTAALEQTMSVTRPVYLLHALLYAMSIGGIVLMYRLRKNGAHLYAVSQLLVIIVSLLFLGKHNLNIGQLMMTLLFIAYYMIAFLRIGQLREALGQQQQTPPAEDPAD